MIIRTSGYPGYPNRGGLSRAGNFPSSALLTTAYVSKGRDSSAASSWTFGDGDRLGHEQVCKFTQDGVNSTRSGPRIARNEPNERRGPQCILRTGSKSSACP